MNFSEFKYFKYQILVHLSKIYHLVFDHRFIKLFNFIIINSMYHLVSIPFIYLY